VEIELDCDELSLRNPTTTGDPDVNHTYRPSSVRPAATLLAALLLVVSLAADAGAAGFGRFQHGGRGVAQMGAFVARADGPAAIYYNPAGLTEVPGVQIEGGVDFSNATDELSTRTETFRADHSIQLTPAVYLSWSDAERSGDWALGLGIDTPQWYRVDWDPVFFPLRTATRLNEVEIWEVHPVVAYRLSDAWSLGGGLRYQLGSTTWGRNHRFSIGHSEQGPFFPVEYTADAEADVDGYGFDVGVQYRSTLWGFGTVYRSEVELEGNGDIDFELRDPPADPSLTPAALDVIRNRRSGFSARYDSPRELVGGIWFAPYPELRFEIDAAWTNWSDSSQEFLGDFLLVVPPDFQRFPVDLHGDWDDTLSVRLGVEGDVSDFVVLSGGVAWEPSPVPSGRIAPAWPRADALVYGLGIGFHYEKVDFDLGYAFHDHDDSAVRLLGDSYSFSSDEQAWSVSARYRF
jgi:long-chain fatty acid transport protein